jgi:hypothetical protein
MKADYPEGIGRRLSRACGLGSRALMTRLLNALGG